MENYGFPPQYDVVGRVPLVENGVFQKVDYYIRGHHSDLKQFGQVVFIDGEQGKETQVSRCGVYPKIRCLVIPNS